METIWKFWNDWNNVFFFSEGIFSVECLVDMVKLLSWKWFLSKNSDPPFPFMSGYSSYFILEQIKFVGVSFLGLDGSGGLEAL
jgi:hypothetical protein